MKNSPKTDVQQAYAGAERVMRILDTSNQIVNSPDAVDFENVSGSISFQNVDFQYAEGISVLKGINFTCKPGQMVAIVGPTGVGILGLSLFKIAVLFLNFQTGFRAF